MHARGHHGQIEEDALFYLRSRGIDELSARKLLLFAFASECLDRMKQGRSGARGRLINRILFRVAMRRFGDRDHREEPEEIGRKSDEHRGQEPCHREPRSPHLRDAGLEFDVEKVRTDFPILRQVHGWALVYLDSTATSAKPQVVIHAIRYCLRAGNANIHRGVHFLSEHATEEYDAARRPRKVSSTPPTPAKIFFAVPPKPSTSWRNLRPRHINAGDEVLITAMEHHSNIVPWQSSTKEGREAADCAYQRPRRNHPGRI